MFTITGNLRSHKGLKITWDNGKLTGDPLLVSEVETEAKIREGESGGPVCGPYTRNDHLTDPLSAVNLISEVLDKVTKSSGDIPEPPEVPPDAII